MDLITLAMAMQNGGVGEQPEINVDSAISNTTVGDPAGDVWNVP